MAHGHVACSETSILATFKADLALHSAPIVVSTALVPEAAGVKRSLRHRSLVQPLSHRGVGAGKATVEVVNPAL